MTQNPKKLCKEQLWLLDDIAKLVENELVSFHHDITDEVTSLSNRAGFILLAHHFIHYCHESDLDCAKVILGLDPRLDVQEFMKVSPLFSTLIQDADLAGRVSDHDFVLVKACKPDTHQAREFVSECEILAKKVTEVLGKDKVTLNDTTIPASNLITAEWLAKF